MSVASESEYLEKLHAYKQCQLAVFAAASELNACTRIGSLPNEVLSEIFLYFSVPPLFFKRQSLYTSNRTAKRLDLRILVTHVCRRWRAVALRCGQLWSHIDFSPSTKSPYVRAVVERSGKCLLALSGTAMPDREAAKAFAIAMQEAARVQHLAVAIDGPTTARYVAGTHGWRIAMPRLETYVNGQESKNDQLLGFVDAPRLRTVSCNATVGEWAGLRDKTNLVDLRIPTFSGGYAACPALPKILDVLRTLPQLERLMLGSLRRQFSTGDTPPVALPNLRSVELEGELTDTMALLAQLDFPLTATISLQPDERYRSGEQNDDWLAAPTDAFLRRLGATARACALDRLELTLHMSNEMYLRGWAAGAAPDAVQFSVLVKMVPAYVYARLRDHFGVGTLRRLHVNNLHRRDTGVPLVALVRACAALEELVLEQLAGDTLLAIFALGPGSVAPLLRLKMLSVKPYILGHKGPCQLDRRCAKCLLFGDLACALQQRIARGRALLRLELSDDIRNVPAECLEYLRGAARELVLVEECS
ncbi:F-box protein [Phanerochaete sordida]|uniref:F-box protein n=1 Tax=Phanerochaete sordida TaxID=48140 RepID=A0A9P3GT60_9APHY|nr:F-box protein [Phanerochaete sordida]